MPATIINAHDVSLVTLAAIGAIAGIYWFCIGFRLLQRKRLILNTPTSKVENAAMGLVEIEGVAASPYVVLSPLKRVECYYYRSLAWQLKRRGNHTSWEKVSEETLHVPFFVDDGSGKVLVDPRGAEIDLHCDFKQEYHRSLPLAGPEMPGSVADFLVRHAVDPGAEIKVEEYCIKPKDVVFVLGTLSQNPGLDVTVTPVWARRVGAKEAGHSGRNREEARGLTHIVRLSEPNVLVPATVMSQQQKIAAALSKAGIANPAAWNASAGGATAPSGESSSAVAVETQFDAGTESDSGEMESFDLHPPVVLMKGSHHSEFFISWKSRRECVQSSGLKSNLMVWGGLVMVLASICLIALFHRL